MSLQTPASFVAAAVMVLAAGGDATVDARSGPASTPACPQGWRASGPTCLLDDDLVLDRPLDLHASLHLNCAGHRITPSAVSPPMVAIVIHDVAGVHLSACRIEGFEHGIYVLRTHASTQTAGSASDQNRITGNTIDARVKGITLYGAVSTLIEDNDIHHASNFGYAVGVSRGSHRNVVRGNRIVLAGGPTGEVAPPDWPGEYLGGAGASPEAPPYGSAIVVANGAAGFAMVQFIVGGTLYQFPNRRLASGEPDLSGVSDNIVAGNDIETSSSQMVITTAARNLRTVIRDNTVTVTSGLAPGGIAIGGANAAANLRLPGSCARQTAIFCTQDPDCNRFGGEPDTCSNPVTVVRVDFRSQDIVVADNDLGPGLGFGIDAQALRTVVRGNHVRGARAAVQVGLYALDDVTIAGNVLEGNGVGLAITELTSAPRLRVSHNDIVGSTVRAVAAPRGWSQSLPLCDESCAEGNHWGRECPEAFRPLPPSPRACTADPARSCDEDATCLEAAAGVCATTDADAPNDLIFDPRPYGEPIGAATSAAPSPCP